MRLPVLGLVLLTICSVVCNGQRSVELPPLIIYPRDGRLLGSAAEHFIFLDDMKRHLVVSFPRDSVDAELAPERNVVAPDQRVTESIPLALDCEPDIDAMIERVDGGALVYRYTVANATNANGAVARLVIALPTVSGIKVDAPSGWRANIFAPHGHIAESLRQMVYGPESWRQKQLARIGDSHHFSYVRWMSGTMIYPGRSLSGYSLTSVRRPGLGRAFVQGINWGIGTKHPMPKFIKEMLYPFNAVENNSKSFLIPVPKFGEIETFDNIVSDYESVVRQAVDRLEISRTGGFYRVFESEAGILRDKDRSAREALILRLDRIARTATERRIVQSLRAALLGVA